jgi:DNA primase large subunit
MARIALAREYLNTGMSAEQVAMIFSEQPDFDYEKTLGYIRHLEAGGNVGNVKMSTLLDQCSSWFTVEKCEKCERDDCKRRG